MFVLENDWLKNYREKVETPFSHYRVLTRSLKKPSAAFPYPSLHAIDPEVSEIFIFDSVDKRSMHIRTDGRTPASVLSYRLTL